MTRINSAIPVEALTDEHLLAEHREIKRLPYCLLKAIKSGSIKKIPKNFTLGKGHVLFFLDKMLFTQYRYRKIHRECERRGFNVIYYDANWGEVPREYFCAYNPTEEEKKLLIERINQRIMESPKNKWHYYGKEISKQEAIEILKNKKA